MESTIDTVTNFTNFTPTFKRQYFINLPLIPFPVHIKQPHCMVLHHGFWALLHLVIGGPLLTTWQAATCGTGYGRNSCHFYMRFFSWSGEFVEKYEVWNYPIYIYIIYIYRYHIYIYNIYIYTYRYIKISQLNKEHKMVYGSYIATNTIVVTIDIMYIYVYI